MIKKINKYLSRNYLPRWIILFFDLTIVAFSLLFAHLLISRLHLNLLDEKLILRQLLLTLPIYFFGFIFFRPFTEIIRHSTISIIKIILVSLSFSGSILLFLSIFPSESSPLYISALVITLQYFISLGILITSRVSIKSIYNSIFQMKTFENKILIYGAGELGQMAHHAIKNDYSLKSKVVAYIDDNKSLHRKRIGGIPVISIEKAFKTTVPAYDITEVIIAIAQDRLKKTSKRKVVDSCIESGIRVKEIPVVSSWIGDELKSNHFKDIEIEDLLGRDAISLDKKKIKEGVKNAIILVTGAAGSIGSEIVRQLISFNAKQVILLDQAESPLYDLQNDIIAANNNPNFEVVIASVTNKKKIRRVFEKYNPNIVFNAAAYKHVPLMEEFPSEAMRVNIGGTKILADLSVEFGVDKFVFISTDKAVNPSNVMGASKRLSEMYIQSLAQNNGISTNFITTRFGNVLGSNGSVVPLFKKQIETGGPITVTHKDIERFFMTIPEACQLVLEAGFMGKGGEIFIFDMGNPVKIINLAEKMISLSGLVPHKDIKIKITGLRPGEKLYEELMDGKEELLPTYNDKIMIGKFEAHNYLKINWGIIKLLNAIDEIEDSELVTQMKVLVPEFISKNSTHAVLDERKEKEAINGKKLYNTRKAILTKTGKRKKIASFLTI